MPVPEGNAIMTIDWTQGWGYCLVLFSVAHLCGCWEVVNFDWYFINWFAPLWPYHTGNPATCFAVFLLCFLILYQHIIKCINQI